MKKTLFIILLALPTLPMFATAATVQNLITWKEPTTRADGSIYNSKTETAKFKVYSEYCTGESVTQEVQGNVLTFTDSYETNKIPCAAKYQLTTVDKNGLESAKSELITVTNTIAAPSAPVGVTVMQK